MNRKTTGRYTNTRFIAIVFALTLTIAGLAQGTFASGPGNDNFANAEVVSGVQVHITRSNALATKEAGEPNHANNAGGKSVWFKWTAPMSGTFAVSTNRSLTNIDTLIAIYTGATLNTLSPGAHCNDITGTNLRSYARQPFVLQGTTYYIAVDGASINGQPAAEGQFLLDIQPLFEMQGADNDLDGLTDISVFRPSTGTWNVLNSSTQQTTVTSWGTTGDVPLVTATGSNSFTVFRPSTGIWYTRPGCCTDVFTSWGTAGDIPVPAQYGGDPESNFGVFRPSNGTWYIYYSLNNYLSYQFGLAGDIPVPGQYGPDRYADIAVFRPSNGTWYFIKRPSSIPAEEFYAVVQFGQAGDKPVPADYDGDGVLDVAVYRPSTGVWYVLRSSDGQYQAFQWGTAEDIPTTGDYDGDGKFDYAVFRPSTATWYVYRSSDSSYQIRQFGQTGDIPVTANKTF